MSELIIGIAAAIGIYLYTRPASAGQSGPRVSEERTVFSDPYDARIGGLRVPPPTAHIPIVEAFPIGPPQLGIHGGLPRPVPIIAPEDRARARVPPPVDLETFRWGRFGP